MLVAAGAWAGGESEQPAAAAATEVDTSAMEAPALAAMVAAGELPPLAERLPSEPLVITPRDELGRYGGTLRRVWRGPSDSSNVKRLMSQRLVRFTPDVSAIVPNLATGFDVSADGTEFTFYLRPGTRWSDGDEFSAEDFAWWYENIFMNTEMTPRPWSWLTVAGEPVAVDKVDEYTVRFRFAAAYGLFTAFLSASQGFNIIHPTHFLKQFHPDFADADELAAAVKEAGFDEWTQITIIVSLIGWTGLARVVRSRLLSVREQDFISAAKIAGSSMPHIVRRHMLPSMLSYIIVSLTLSVPGMILAETSLSFLGLGLRAPVTSWGVLLKEAQNVQTVGINPWLILPVFAVIITVLAYNFLGDGLRDAADPYR